MPQAFIQLMQIEIKENQIIIQFSEKETAVIVEKVGNAEIENIAKYIKGKLIKALSLDVENSLSALSVGKDFNLTKIKKVTAELKKRNDKTDKVAGGEEVFKAKPANDPFSLDEELNITSVSESDEDSEMSSLLTEEIGDELLAELLDHNLLKGGQKPKKEPES